MKSLVLVPLLAAIAACGGGGGGAAESAKPTIVECMTPKAGVKFETADRRAKLGPVQIDYYGPYDARYEVVADQFEGRLALSIRTYQVSTAESGAVSRDFTYADAVVATSSGFQLLGREGPVDHPNGYMRLVYSPPVTTPAALTIGTTALRQYAGTYTRTVAGAADEVRTVSSQDRIEWLGYEDIPVAEGHTLQNVCKVRVSRGMRPLAYEWYAAGYGLVARGADVDGKLEMQQVPTRIEQAP